MDEREREQAREANHRRDEKQCEHPLKGLTEPPSHFYRPEAVWCSACEAPVSAAQVLERAQEFMACTAQYLVMLEARPEHPNG